MAVSRVFEREVTYEVDVEWALPVLDPVVRSGGRLERETLQLDATYYDTVDSTLRRLGLTLRRRTGGSEPPWQLKIPVSDGRSEVHSNAAGMRVPQSLRRRVDGVVGDEPVEPVATIDTTRHVTRVLDANGVLVAEIADDQVVGQALVSSHEDAADPHTAEPLRWREVEVELGPAGDSADLAAFGALLESAGARTAGEQRKINHVLGTVTSPVDGLDGIEDNRIARVIAAYATDQVEAILLGDIRLRDELTPESVHQTRVAIRRLRSTLRTLPGAFTVDRDEAGTLDEDLSWLGDLLSPVRDSDVLGPRLEQALDTLDAADIVGPVREEVRRALAADRAAAISRWRDAHDDPRYRKIMDLLRSYFTEPPVDPDARVHPRKALKKARRAVTRRLAEAAVPDDLHRARKAAKRLRYLGDLLVDELPSADRAATKAKHVQTTLGDHQDLVVTAEFVRRLGSGRGLVPVHSGYTYGVLVGHLERDAAAIEPRL